MICRPVVSVCLLLSLVLAGGCRSPQLTSRPMTPTEIGWASAIQRSYPGWRPPYLLPKRDDWQGEAPTESKRFPILPPPSDPATAPVPVATAAGTTTPSAVPVTRETVVKVTVPAPPAMLPPVQTAGVPAVSPEPQVTPAKVVEPELNDVEFVPADR